MGIYIGMKKFGENENTVTYCFDMRVVDKRYYKPGENFPYRVDTHNAYGYCALNKITKEFTVDQEKTDQYYFTEDKRAILRVQRILNEILESGEKFPDRTQYAS